MLFSGNKNGCDSEGELLGIITKIQNQKELFLFTET